MALQHLRSSTADKRPTPAAMSDGQLALNTNLASPGLFFKDSNGDSVKIGPVHVGTTAPNATPGAGGQAGNSVGEQWLDTTGGVYVFKIYDGTAWRSETGTFVDVNGDTMTGALGIIAGSAAAPGLFFSGDNTGIYSPGADQVAIATGGTQRVTVDASGRLGIGTSSPGYSLDVAAADATEGFGVRIRANATAGKAGLQFTNSDASTELTRVAADSNGLRIASSIFLFDATAPYPTAATGQIASKTNSPVAYSHLVLGNGTQGYFYVNVADSYGWNAATHVLGLGKISANNRSINAAGTINASGADYAEYMFKAGDFDLAKGDVCGVNANGEVTNTFVDSVSFVVKSTNPSYVGGDTWGTEEIVGAKPPLLLVCRGRKSQNRHRTTATPAG
jgi:hypothetical protein